jgi:hypothetical protein
MRGPRLIDGAAARPEAIHLLQANHLGAEAANDTGDAFEVQGTVGR